MNLIAAVDLNWALGNKGKLLERIPEDMKFFKESTIGKIVVMGRVTLESLPGQKPLSDRTNIILTSDSSFSCEGAIICNSMEELVQELKKYKSEDIFIAGGQSVYTQLLPCCEYAYITKIYKEHEADRFLANLDELSQWEIVSEGEMKTHKDIQFKFMVYRNIA